MATSSKQQLVRLYAEGRLSLPALSFLALITGFTFSLTLPSSLQALMPAMESLFLVSLPHLWRASLSWITPPCLFVLLNGIIMILTATSGRSFSSSDVGSSELEPNLATQIENVPFKQSAATVEHHALAELHASRSTATPILDDALQIGGPLDIHIPFAPALHTQDAELVIEASSQHGYDDADKQLALNMNLQDTSTSASTAKIDPEHDATGDDDPFTSSSLACEEIGKAGSEPSSPHFSSSPPVKANIRRSMSIDSALFIDNNEGASEQLSEEAFKKRIDDFILKVNSKIRSETRVIG